jgi:ParB family chromosome partitioning protein
MIIAGERRFRAAKIVGLKFVPAIVKDYSDKEINEISIIENLQREDLNPMEAARAMKKLMEDYGWTQEVVADRLGKSRPVIANTIRLLNLEPEVIKMIEEGKISAGHARSLVGIANKQAQIKLAQQVANRKLTVRDLENAVKATNKKPNIQNQAIELKALIQDMQRVFGTKVSALGSNERGRIYIDYFNRDDLERIYQKVDILKKNIK